MINERDNEKKMESRDYLYNNNIFNVLLER